MYKGSSESADQSKFNVDAALNYWISKGAPRDKLVVGLASYGHSVKLADVENFKLGSSAEGPGNPGIVGIYDYLKYYLRNFLYS